MIHNKRGLSEVVSTLIIILLVLVAIGIVWVVVSNVLQSGASQTEIGAKCLQVDVKANAVNCASNNVTWECDVTYNRKSGGDAIDGIKIVLSNGLESSTASVAGNVAPLDVRTQSNINTTIVIANAEPSSAQIAAFFIDDSGNEQVCNPTGAFEF